MVNEDGTCDVTYAGKQVYKERWIKPANLRRAKPLVDCKYCDGKGKLKCNSCEGKGTFIDPRCHGCQRARQKLMRVRGLGEKPAEGLRIAVASAAELSSLQKLWAERGGSQPVVLQAWTIDNPLLSWRFSKKRQSLSDALGQDADELQGFHGTPSHNILSISQSGFDQGRRAGQVFGAGEYFAKNPDVSRAYCRGGEYMLVCRLSLGKQASDAKLGNGDHIWVEAQKYYVIKDPDQVLPTYIIKFSYGDSVRPTPTPEALREVLDKPGGWSSLEKARKSDVPKNRECFMTADTTHDLWIGYLRPDLDDGMLEGDVRKFLESNSCNVMRLQIVRGRYTQAKCRLWESVTQQQVKALCAQKFVEAGSERKITVDDAHGSKGQPCPRSVARYCRGRNLGFVDPCWCMHDALPTDGASYELVPLGLNTAKGDEISSKLMASTPFHDGRPVVVAINSIQNKTLQSLHEHYRSYLREKNGEEPKSIELYHGTNNEVLDVVYTHGIQPPSDRRPSDACPISGGKGLCTTLCDNQCEYCIEKHEWNKCHMFGLGIYLADIAQKSHRYCSRPVMRGSRRQFRMVVCSVLQGKPLQLEAHLRKPDAMHDMFSLRACYKGDLEGMVEFVDSQKAAPGEWAGDLPVEQHDLLFVKGLGDKCKRGFSVVNSEYLSFHPYQCLPRYEVVYEM